MRPTSNIVGRPTQGIIAPSNYPTFPSLVCPCVFHLEEGDTRASCVYVAPLKKNEHAPAHGVGEGRTGYCAQTRVFFIQERMFTMTSTTTTETIVIALCCTCSTYYGFTDPVGDAAAPTQFADCHLCGVLRATRQYEHNPKGCMPNKNCTCRKCNERRVWRDANRYK